MTKSISSAVEELKSGVHDALDPEMIERACRLGRYRWRERTLGPVSTVWMFALQLIYRTACTEAVRLLPGVEVTDSGYCQARRRIPIRVFRHLADLVARQFIHSVDRSLERWRGHRVFLVDGSSCSMPDTPDLQRAFGQPSGQAKGLGFPVASVVGLFHGASGLLLELLVNPLYTSEISVVRQLFRWLRRGDVLVADRAYASYSILTLLRERGVHAVMRLHQSRRADFRRGTPLGINDQIVHLSRPRHRPPWMNLDEFRTLPRTLTVRQIRYELHPKGYRTRKVVVITTLLDSEQYPAADVAALYGHRWEVETCYRHLKTTLEMDVLRCRSEDMVRKELLMHTVIYNLVRVVMVQAGLQQGVSPDRISLIDVVRHLARGSIDLDELPSFVVNRKRRRPQQPRAVKRRPKAYARLTSTRRQMCNAMKAWGL